MNTTPSPQEEKENIYAHIARFFVQNKQLSLLLTLASFVFGIMAFIATPKQYNPEITLPAFRIVTEYPGATADEVERFVTNEVENKLAELPGVDTLSSYSFDGGRSVVLVTFEIGTDLDQSKTEVIQKMQANLHLAPLGVGAPLIQQVDPENVPVMTLAISSREISQDGLRAYAFDLREDLKTIPGVTNIEVSGGRSRVLSVTLLPDALAARNVSVNEVEGAIRANDLRMRVGVIEGVERNTSFVLDGSITSSETLARLVVGGSPASPVYLEDVAAISDGYGVVESHVGLSVRDIPEDAHTVFLSLAKTQGVNVTNVTTAVHERVDELVSLRMVPDSVELEVTRDEGEIAGEEIMVLTEHLALAIAIVTITLIFFLGFRAALVVATAIPLTLALVFIAGYFFDQTINRITLFALIFSLGLLVDDAIVVVENIHRRFLHKREGRVDAIAHATGEVGMGVLLSTVTAIIVFVPMGLVTGMMGAYMGPIAFFAPIARLMSLFVAYSLSPYIASIFLKESEKGDSLHEEKEEHSRLDAAYTRFIHRILDDRSLQNKILVGTLVGVVLAFALPVVELVHFRMLPKADKEQFYVYVDMPVGTALPSTREFADAVKSSILTDPEVKAVEYFVGTPPVADFNGLFRGSDMRDRPEHATMKVSLTHPKERSVTSEEIVTRVRADLSSEYGDVPDVRLRLVEDPPGPPVLSTLLARVKGPDSAVRDDIARDLLALFRATPGVVDLDTGIASGVTEEVLMIDHEKLARSGLSVSEVATALRTALSGNAVAVARLGEMEESKIIVRFAGDGRDDIADIGRVTLKNATGQAVALSSVTRIERVALPAPIVHDERESASIVMGETEGRAVVYVVKDLIIALMDYKLPSGNGELLDWNLYGLTYRDTESNEEYRIEWGGEFEMTLDNFRDLGLAMLVSYFLIYVVLVAQFRSFRTPMLIMSTIILGFAGVLPGFALLDFSSGLYFSATSMIGIIALGGIVVGNAILLLDFIEQLRARGRSVKMSIIGACQTRLRPIMLTSLTAVLGSAVIVVDPVWSGLAWAFIFGLSLSTVLTLVIFPILYLRFSGAKDE